MEGKNKKSKSPISNIGKLTLMGLGFSFLSTSAFGAAPNPHFATDGQLKTTDAHILRFVAGTDTTGGDAPDSCWIIGGTNKIEDGKLVQNDNHHILKNGNTDIILVNPGNNEPAEVGENLAVTVEANFINGKDYTLNNAAGVFQITPGDGNKATNYNLIFRSGYSEAEGAKAKVDDGQSPAQDTYIDAEGKIINGKAANALQNFAFKLVNADLDIVDAAGGNILTIDNTNMHDNDTVTISAQGMLLNVADNTLSDKNIHIGKIETNANKNLNLVFSNDTLNYITAKYIVTGANAGEMAEDSPKFTANAIKLSDISGDPKKLNLTFQHPEGYLSSSLPNDFILSGNIQANNITFGNGDTTEDPENSGDYFGDMGIKLDPAVVNINNQLILKNNIIFHVTEDSTLTFKTSNGVKKDDQPVIHGKALVFDMGEKKSETDEEDSEIDEVKLKDLTFNVEANKALTIQSSAENDPIFTLDNGSITLKGSGTVKFAATPDNEDAPADHFVGIELAGNMLKFENDSSAKLSLTGLTTPEAGHDAFIHVSNNSSIEGGILNGLDRTGPLVENQNWRPNSTISVENNHAVRAIAVDNGKTLSLSGDLTIKQEGVQEGGKHLIHVGEGAKLALISSANGDEEIVQTMISLEGPNGQEAKPATVYFAEGASLGLNPDVTLRLVNANLVADGALNLDCSTIVESALDLDEELSKKDSARTLIYGDDQSLGPVYQELGLLDDVKQVEVSPFINNLYFVKGSLKLKKGSPDDPITWNTVREVYANDLDGISDSFIDRVLGDDIVTDTTNPFHSVVVTGRGINPNFGQIMRYFARTTTEEKNRMTLQLVNTARKSIYNHIDINDNSRYDLWASLFGSLGRQSNRGGYKMNSNIYGFLVGIDTHFNEGLTFGIVGGFGKTKGKIKGGFVDGYTLKNDPKSYFGGIYGEWLNLNNDMSVKFLALVGKSKHKDLYNKIRVNGSTVAPEATRDVSKHNAKWISANVDFSYKPWGFSGLNVGPWASLSFTHNKQNAQDFEDFATIGTGVGNPSFSKSISKAKVHALEATLGIAADYGFGQGILDLKAGFKHDFRHKVRGGDVTLTQKASGASGQSVMDTKTFSPYYNTVGKNTFVAEASYTAQFNNVGVSLGAEGEFGNKWKDFAGSISASYSF